STAERSTGKKKQNGSIASNRIDCPGRVKRQFMVKVKGDQSVSITPVNGAIASLARFGEPPIHKFQPGGVRMMAWTWKVSTAWPNSETGTHWRSAPWSGWIVTALVSVPPSQIAVNP